MTLDLSNSPSHDKVWLYHHRQGPRQATGTLKMGKLWVKGNRLPTQSKDHYSTISAPLTIPAAAKVTTYPAQQLKTKVLPYVGAPHRTKEEQQLLAEIAASW